MRVCNKIDMTKFSADDMFVRNGKTGVDHFHGKTKALLRDIDKSTFNQRFQKIANAQAQIIIMEEMASNMKHDADKDSNTYFKGDYPRTTALLDEGDNLMPNKPGSNQKINDNFATLILKKSSATFADLTKIEKAKVMLAKSMMNQRLNMIPMTSQMVSMSPQSETQKFDIISVPTGSRNPGTVFYKCSFDDDGGLTVSAFRMQTIGTTMDLGENANHVENGQLRSTEPIHALMRTDMHVSAEEVNRYASLDWENFNARDVSDTCNQQSRQNLPHFFENFPETVIPKDYHIDIETSAHLSFVTSGTLSVVEE